MFAVGPASGQLSYTFSLFLQDQREKVKMCCVISESFCVISGWEWCPLPVANVLKTGPRDKDRRRGNLLAAHPQWNSFSEIALRSQAFP